MNNRRILRSTCAGLLILGLAGCSTIKSWFPDKEKDYQFTSEIPELIVPDDLKTKGLASLEPQAIAQTDAETESLSGAEVGAASEGGDTAETVSDTRADQPEAEQRQVEIAPVAGGASSLQIDQGQTPATRMVGRALTRKQLEIVERNIDKGFFYVKFDPDAVEVKDDSIWDELNFMFGDDPSKEEEYRITVHQIAEQSSEVTIQDSSGKTLSNAVANALLKLITEGINEVVKQDNASETAPAESNEQKQPETSAEPQ
ncbi:MAG: outer membrane protein assembly factor BamC [Methylomonas sp.]|nr:outer membrane protein assembly factor BamC [Methylomonas sp.]